ncbi:hypothetical protein SAMN05444411_102386 [Lutibacter oricola]|uniref:Uncharacterized protein n=1 Tax=Lutibacter oricola TaxID=762486 RepID=A0A1H2X6Y7_9FLAO|nr:hypothetical protein [Lutibacter oricola]SDW88575.1 hypothetical protein SAMN05444411_102386 [Lutibacter oricola]
MNLLKKYQKAVNFSLLLFFISALFGLLIRYNFTYPISKFSYANFLQGHSHIAFLGWGYLVALVLILKVFIYKKEEVKKLYFYSILILTLSILLMLISFPLTGYKSLSIALLAIFGIVSYVPSISFLRDLKQKSLSVRFIKTGVVYYLISSLATWFLPYVIISHGKTDLYYNTVYFYLHFLYNGFFVFVIFGVVLEIFKNSLKTISTKNSTTFYWLLNLACIPTYFLSVLWSSEHIIFNVLGGVGGLLQVLSLFYLIKISVEILKSHTLLKVEKKLFLFGVSAFCFKIIAQFLSSFPYFVEKSIALKPFFIIGYLHLFTLGFMSVFLLLILSRISLLNLKLKLGIFGVYLLLIGILVTELVLFTKGFSILVGVNILINYTYLMLVFSTFMVVGILLMFVNQFSIVKKL